MKHSDETPSLNGYLALIVFGGVIIAGFFANLGREPQFYNFWENLLYTTVFGFLPAGYGFVQYRKGHQKFKLIQEDFKEYQLIRLAAENSGKLTAVDVAIQLKTTHQKAKQILNELQQKGVFTIKVHDEGVVVYHLVDFLPELL